VGARNGLGETAVDGVRRALSGPLKGLRKPAPEKNIHSFLAIRLPGLDKRGAWEMSENAGRQPTDERRKSLVLLTFSRLCGVSSVQGHFARFPSIYRLLASIFHHAT
jgi:hypothetical protein